MTHGVTRYIAHTRPVAELVEEVRGCGSAQIIAVPFGEDAVCVDPLRTDFFALCVLQVFPFNKAVHNALRDFQATDT